MDPPGPEARAHHIGVLVRRIFPPGCFGAIAMESLWATAQRPVSPVFTVPVNSILTVRTCGSRGHTPEPELDIASAYEREKNKGSTTLSISEPALPPTSAQCLQQLLPVHMVLLGRPWGLETLLKRHGPAWASLFWRAWQHHHKRWGGARRSGAV